MSISSKIQLYSLITTIAIQRAKQNCDLILHFCLYKRITSLLCIQFRTNFRTIHRFTLFELNKVAIMKLAILIALSLMAVFIAEFPVNKNTLYFFHSIALSMRVHCLLFQVNTEEVDAAVPSPPCCNDDCGCPTGLPNCVDCLMGRLLCRADACDKNA